MHNITAIIPAYNPDKKFHVVIDGLIQAGFKHIIVVNDGTDSKFQSLFDKVEHSKYCTLITHEENLGKGRALKTAFKYFLKHFPNDIGVVTLDADNQHKIKDVVNCARALKQSPSKLVLGVRNFNIDNVPKKSSLGNKATSLAFKFFCDLNISDTQTGLRAIPSFFVEKLLNTIGEKFEFETNMLLDTKIYGIKIMEVPIETVYIDGNTKSNFNPLLDSFSIYRVIVKFLCSSFSAVICDYTLFILLGFAFDFLPHATSLLIATVIARLVSSLINFTINRKVVFKNNSKFKKRITRYYILVSITILLSYTGIYILTTNFNFSEVFAKIIMDLILFLLSFKLQTKWVFKN